MYYFDNAFNLFMQLDSSSPDSLSWCGTEQLGHSAKYWASRLTKITSLLFILICIFQMSDLYISDMSDIWQEVKRQ